MNKITSKIRYQNLSFEKKNTRANLHKVFESVLRSGNIVNNSSIIDLEKLVQKDSHRRYSVAVGSGTGALWLALKLAGVGPGDEVITSALGWLGTVNPIYLCGAVAKFVDVNDDLNISANKVAEAINSKTKAIIAVHYTGLPCEIEKLKNISKAHKVFLIEDCAQAYGAKVKEKPIGSFGHCAAFSMNPMKIFAAIGEAGAVSFDNKDWLEKAKSLRHNGLCQKEFCLEPSLNNKPDALQCGFLVSIRDKLSQKIKQRNKNSDLYNAYLKKNVILPHRPPGRVFYMYTIRAKKRDKLQKFLADRGIESKVRHPVLLNEQKAYLNTEDSRQSLIRTPNAQKLKNEILSLPIHEKLKPIEIEYICNTINKFYQK